MKNIGHYFLEANLKRDSSIKNRNILIANIYRLFFVFIIFLFLSFIGYLSTLSILKIELETDNADELQLYWSNEKSNFLEGQSITKKTTTGRDTYWFFIGNFNKSIRFRIDPTKHKGSLKIHDISLYTLQYQPILLNSLEYIVKTNQIVKTKKNKGYFFINATGDDPYIEIRPILIRNNFFYLSVFFIILIIGYKQNLKIIALLFFSFIAIYSMISLSSTNIDISVDSKENSFIKIFWRNASEKNSYSRAKVIHINPDENTYSTEIGNLSNINVIYLEYNNTSNNIHIKNTLINEPGFSQIISDKKEIIIQKKSKFSSLLSYFFIFLVSLFLLYLFIYKCLQNDKKFSTIILPLLFKIAFLINAMMVINLAWQADYNIHPDENAHIESVKYYSTYWDPPIVGDPRASEAYQMPWAISRLDDLGISYFLAGKFKNIMHLFFSNNTFTARAFNAFLFLSLFLISKKRRFLFFLAPLLCTPQFSYLFSYANRGAFVLVVSILLAWQLTYQHSALNIFLKGKQTFTNFPYLLIPGFLLGILSIEQTNYVLFILFIFSFLLWKLLFFIEDKRTFIFKCLLFLAVGGAIFSVRLAVDRAINGANKSEQRVNYAENHAGTNFKPSIAATKDSYSGLRLKDKGVGFTEIFNPEWEWHKMTFKSFTGFYGYYAEYSPKWYYAYVLIIYGLIFLLVTWHSIYCTQLKYKIFSLLCLTAILGGILMGILFSWLYDFQPQGRYIFPIIPIILVYFGTTFPMYSQRQQSILLSCAFMLIILSMYSFNEVALNYLFS